MQRFVRLKAVDHFGQIFGQQIRLQSRKKMLTQTDLLNAKSFDEIPGNKSIWKMMKAVCHQLPVIGDYCASKMRISDDYFEGYRIYGKIYRVNILPNFKVVIITDPEDIRKALKYDGKFPNRRMLDFLKVYRYDNKDRYSSAGLAIEAGKTWYDTRIKVQQPMLKPQTVDQYMNKIAKVADKFVMLMKAKRIGNGEIPNYLNEIYKWNLETMGLIIFNTSFGCLENKENEDSHMWHQLVTSARTVNEVGSKFALWYGKWSKNYKIVEKSSEILHKFVTMYTEETKQRLNNKLHTEMDVGILESIIRQNIDDREVTAFLIDLFQAGIDTTSHSLAGILYQLARNPNKQEILHTKIETIMKHNKVAICRDTLEAIPYLKSCIQESIRLMPVTIGTSRCYDHDIVLSGYRIPAGTQVVFLLGLTGKLPEYFEEPLKFKPERWLPDAQKLNPHAYLPFGSGPKSCIGRRIAMLELQLLLIKIIQNFKIEYHYEDIEMETGFINIPNKPLKLKFIDRK